MKLIFRLVLPILFVFLPFSFAAAQDSDLKRYGPDYYELSMDAESELVLVYIGASWCGPCHEPVLKKALEKIKITLAERAQADNTLYSVIGIANDQSVKKGWDFLQSSGYFDEVIIGKKWMNQGAIEFIWNHESPQPAVPQVIVFERSLNLEKMVTVGEKNYLIRLRGYNQIAQWAENGMKFNK